VKLIGERIESYEQFDRCKAAGVGYFQGYVFCQPKAVAGKASRRTASPRCSSSPRSRTPR
jgi:EAL and modified HD-GYP domain-containing signal transduction protein